MLELGSGLGLGGAAAAQAGARRVVCTDMDDELVEMLSSTGDAYQLDWCDDESYLNERFDCVIGADVAYENSVVPDLVRATLAHAAADGARSSSASASGRRCGRCSALPADQVRALDYDMERVVSAEPPPPPENFGIHPTRRRR